jgi:hypothetical protein
LYAFLIPYLITLITQSVTQIYEWSSSLCNFRQPSAAYLHFQTQKSIESTRIHTTRNLFVRDPGTPFNRSTLILTQQTIQITCPAERVPAGQPC